MEPHEIKVPDFVGLFCSLAGTLSVESPKQTSGQEWTKASSRHDALHEPCSWTPFAFVAKLSGWWNKRESSYIFQSMQPLGTIELMERNGFL